MQIDVRPAVGDDAEAIAEAHVAAWRAAYRGVVPDEMLDSPALDEARRLGWQRRFDDREAFVPPGWDPHDELFAAELDGRVVGFGNVGREWRDPDHDPGVAGVPELDTADEPRGEIYGFYVHPDAWGSGLADVLIETCHRSLRRRFSSATLWVLRENPRARRFYERHGWTHPATDPSATATWTGPQMDGLPSLDTALTIVQYGRVFPAA